MSVSERTYITLCTVVLLRVFLNEPRYERHASEAIVGIARVAASHDAQDCSGKAQSWVDLAVLVGFWMDSCMEIREAARLLFGVRLGAMSNEEILELVSNWQTCLPFQEFGTNQTESYTDLTVHGKLSESSDQDLITVQSLSPINVPGLVQADAMLLIGLIVSERYKLLSTKILKDLSMSVFQAINPTQKKTKRERQQQQQRLDEESYMLLMVAIEVCSKCFEMIQHYIDAIELLRSLFGWATGKGGEDLQPLKVLAKQACLHVVSVNTPLFMTTLSYDLMMSQDPDDRICTMKLIIFMIRRRPLVLHPSLPRLVESIMKSLDPNYKQMRNKIQPIATIVLIELIKTYPTITYHQSNQKLGLGTPEGAIIIYDLKTGRKMKILERNYSQEQQRPESQPSRRRQPSMGGHDHHQITACSFSPKGNYLICVCLNENKIEIWKMSGENVGMDVMDLFNELFHQKKRKSHLVQSGGHRSMSDSGGSHRTENDGSDRRNDTRDIRSVGQSGENCASVDGSRLSSSSRSNCNLSLNSSSLNHPPRSSSSLNLNTSSPNLMMTSSSDDSHLSSRSKSSNLMSHSNLNLKNSTNSIPLTSLSIGSSTSISSSSSSSSTRRGSSNLTLIVPSRNQPNHSRKTSSSSFLSGLFNFSGPSNPPPPPQQQRRPDDPDDMMGQIGKRGHSHHPQHDDDDPSESSLIHNLLNQNLTTDHRQAHPHQQNQQNQHQQSHQNHYSGQQPFKVLHFNLGDEAMMMSLSSTLEWVKIEWLHHQTCCLKIKEHTLTFSF